MRADTFKTWLEDKGCRFDKHEKEKGGGNASLIIKLGDKRSVLPLVGTNMDLDNDNMDRILQELGLDSADLPGHVEGEKRKPGERHDREAKASASDHNKA